MEVTRRKGDGRGKQVKGVKDKMTKETRLWVVRGQRDIQISH